MFRSDDLKSLTGKWQGWLTGAGSPQSAVVTVNTDGSYVALFGPYASSGSLRIVDGVLMGSALASRGHRWATPPGPPPSTSAVASRFSLDPGGAPRDRTPSNSLGRSEEPLGSESGV